MAAHGECRNSHSAIGTKFSNPDLLLIGFSLRKRPSLTEPFQQKSISRRLVSKRTAAKFLTLTSPTDRRAGLHRTKIIDRYCIGMPYNTLAASLRPGARTSFHIVFAILIVCFGFARSACAEVRISGDAAALKVVVQSASLIDVLRALQTTFKFHYQQAGTLPDVISGTYSGSLRSVLARLLTGHDYIIRGSQDDLTITIVPPKGGPAANRAPVIARGREPPPPEDEAPPTKPGECVRPGRDGQIIHYAC